MRFSAIHKLSSYLVVLSAVASLLLSPDISSVAVVLCLISIALSWFAEPPRYNHERYTLVWNIATAAYFFYQAADVFRGGSLITSGAYFLLFVLANKLFNRRASKDYQQIYVVSFLVLVVATTLNTNISYAIFFSLFILFTTWALSLLHLRREMEENYLLKHADGLHSEKVEVERILNSRRIVSGGFLAGTSLISIGIILVAALIFTLFPRIGFGLFLGHKRGRVAMVGFSDRVELGHHGVIRDNPQVVMRVFFPGGKPRRPLLWRGSVFDHYSRGVWSHAPGHGRPGGIDYKDGMYITTRKYIPELLPPMDPPFIRKHLLRQDIYLEPLNSTVIFAADRPVALEVAKTRVNNRLFFIPREGPNGEIRGSKMRTAGVKYSAYSYVRTPSPELLRRSAPLSSGAARQKNLLQLPPDLPRRIGALARKITRGKKTVYDRVIAIQRYLKTHYRYTLKLTHDRRLEPVDEFLFVTRQGHCEYFSSAMTLMLRHLGIHARTVNGFAGGDWNAMGNYLAVRQGDAHAWVEVLFTGVGYVAFDPTPSSAGAAATAAGWTTRVSHYWDTLRLRWFQYVVEYDLGKQASILQKVKQALRPDGAEAGWLAALWRPLAIASAFLLCIAGLVIWRRRRRRRGDDPAATRTAATSPTTTMYCKLLRLLNRTGHTKPTGITPMEFVEALRAAEFPAAELVDRFTRCYNDLRFGAAGPTADRSRELGALLGELRVRLGQLRS